MTEWMTAMPTDQWLEMCQEKDALTETVEIQRKILDDASNLLNGLPPDGKVWSHRDIPELIAKVLAERDNARAQMDWFDRELKILKDAHDELKISFRAYQRTHP